MNIFSRIFHLFTSDKAKAIADKIEHAVIDAGPIVAKIASLVPNKTAQEIAAAYDHYGVSYATEAQQGGTGVALRDLATTILRQTHHDATANVLNAAVELALAAHVAQ